MKNSVIIAIIIIIAVVIVGAYAAISMTSTTNKTTDNKTKITANGSKVTIINNNKNVWAHWKLMVQNAPQKNGTKQTYYVDAFIKPGENATFDLSTMLGYENTPLPQDTNITVLGWGGLYNTNASGTSKFNTTLLGWTTNQTIPSPTATYKDSINAINVDPQQTVGPLPSGITTNTITIGTTDPGTKQYDLLSAQFNILIGPNGVPYFRLGATPTLCNVIAQG